MSLGDEVAAGTGHASAWPRPAGRLRTWLAAHSLFADIMLTAIVLGAIGSAMERKVHGWHVPAVFLIEAAVVAPLALRRRYPLTVFGALYAVGVNQLWFGRVALIDVAVLVALYTVAAHCDRQRALIAVAVTEIGVLLAAVRWGMDFQGSLMAFVFLSGLVTAAFVLGVNLQTRRAYLASLEDRATRAERERDQQSQLAAAAERARIAREMHDIVAHNLSVMIALADGVAYAARRDPVTAQAAAEQVAEAGRHALTEMQRLVGVLRGTERADPRAPQPGLDQIDELVTQVRAAGLPTTLTVAGTPFPVPPTAQLAIYRVVQESLTNVLKHAKDPSQAQVTVNYAEPTIILRVADDGRDSRPVPDAPAGHGLAGMRERAMVFDGRVDAGPRPLGGWQVRAILTCPRTAT